MMKFRLLLILTMLCHALHAQQTEEFIAALPEEFRDRIEPTFEIQIRTVFSEGWHEVEHDLRNMKAIFADMERQNFKHSNYTAMLRNKFHLRFTSDSLSEKLNDYLKKNRHLAEAAQNSDRLIVTLWLLNRKKQLLCLTGS